MSDPAPEKAPKEDQGGGGGVTTTQLSVNVSITLGLKTVYYIFLVMATLGMLMLWFEADQLRGVSYWTKPTAPAAPPGGTSGSSTGSGSSSAGNTYAKFLPAAMTGNVHPYTNLWIALVLFIGVDLSDTFIPPFAKKLVRSFATLMYIFNIDRAICTLNTYTLMGDGENHVYGSPEKINQRNMGRMGGALVMLPSILIIFITYFRKRPNFSGLLQGGLPSLVFFVRIIALMLILFAQVMVWSIKTNCAGPAWDYAANAMTQWTIIVQLVLMISGCFFGDNEAYDLSLLMVMWNVFNYCPLFDDVKAVNGNQDSFPGIWRTEVAMMFIGSQLYTWCAFCDGKRDKSKTVIERIKSVPFIVQTICAFVGFAAAICIWARSPEPHQEVTYYTKLQVYLGCYALIIPFYMMLSTITGSRVIHLFCIGYTAFLGMPVANLINSGIWGYLRGGFIIEMFVCFFAVMIKFFVGAPSVKPVHEYFEGSGKMDVFVSGIIAYFAALGYESGRIDYLFWFAIALYVFFGKLTESHDLSRICYFLLMWVLTDTSKLESFWPLLPGQGPKVLESTLFLVGMYYIWQFASRHEGRDYECVGHFAEDDIAERAAERAHAGDGDSTTGGKYQSLDDNTRASDAKSESLITNPETNSPRNEDDNTRESGAGGYQAAEIDSDSNSSSTTRRSKKEKKKKNRSRSGSLKEESDSETVIEEA